MKTVLLPVSSPKAIAQAVEILNSGGLVAFPTDTVYGLGVSAFDAAAVESIYAVKGRSLEKAIPVLVADVEALHRVAGSIPDMALTLAAHFWPGALTLVIPKHPALPEGISSNPTIGVRIPGHAAVRGLLQVAGPLAVTSANLSGQSSPISAEEVLAHLGGRIHMILDGGITSGGVPSTVVDCTGTEPRILRQGAVSRLEIYQSLGISAEKL